MRDRAIVIYIYGRPDPDGDARGPGRQGVEWIGPDGYLELADGDD
jgi:hypothetical protein